MSGKREAEGGSRIGGQREAEGGSRSSTVLAPGDRLREWWTGLSRVQKWFFGMLLFGALALLPLYTPPFLDTPGISFGGTMAQFAMVAIIAIGLNVVVGQAGLLDLGYVGFYAVGAYTVALLTSPDSPWNKLGATGLFSTPWAWLSCVPLAMAFTAVAGLILGFPTLRLRGDYLAIVTLGFGEIIPQLFYNFDQWTGGINAVGIIDQPVLPAWIQGPWSGDGPFAVVTNFSFNGDPIAYYVLICILIAGAVILVSNLYRSRLGRAWMAIREDEVAAAAMGINTVTTKLLAFAIGASFSGFAGAYYGASFGLVSPDSFLFVVSVTVLVMVVLGGMGNITGVIVGALVIYFVLNNLLPALPPNVTALANFL